MKNFLTFALLLFTFGIASAQDDLFQQLDSVKSTEKEVETAAFKALQICNMQSTKLPVKGEFYFLITHRFGDLANGLDNFFGLDNALTKVSGIWGVTNWLSLGVSRHTYNKTYELQGKYKFADQTKNGFPLTIVGYNTIDINSSLSTDIAPGLKFNNRLAFSNQLIISRKISDAISLEVAPIYVHKNLYDDTLEQKDTYLVGIGGRCKLTKRISANLEYAARVSMPDEFVSQYKNPLSVGLDIETGGHIFQFVFSNSQPMNDVTLYTNTTGSWEGKKSLFFGFNMYRVF